MAGAAGEPDLVAVRGVGEPPDDSTVRPPTAPSRCPSKTSALAPPLTSARASEPRGRCTMTSLAPPEMRTGTTPTGRGRKISMSLAPPVTSSLVRRSSRKSATSFHIPPRSETSQGTAAESAKSADWLRQSNGRKRRRCCTVTVPPVTVISGAGPSKVARYSSVSVASPRRVTLAAPLVNSRRPAVDPGQRGVALRVGGAVAGGLTGPRRRLRRERGDLVLVHAPRAAQVVADHGELVLLAALEERPCGELDLALDARADLARGHRRDHQYPAAVGRVRDPVGVAALLQAVEHRGDRSRREAALLRQSRRR